MRNVGGVGKLFAIIAVVAVGLDLQGRWTGQSFNMDFTGLNRVGAGINAARTAARNKVAP